MSAARIRTLVIAISVAILATCVGCQKSDEDETPRPSANSPEPNKPQDLKLLSLDDSQHIAARIGQVWGAQTAGQVEVIEMTSEELRRLEPRDVPPFDVVVFPSLQLGDWLARDLIQPLDVSQIPEMGTIRRSLLRHDRTTVAQSGKSIYGVSLGSPMLMLLYRRDVFDSLHLEVPRSWDQYREALVKLRDAGPEFKSGDGKPLPTGVCEPSAGRWPAEWLLARTAAAIVRQGRLSSCFDIESMKSLINTPPFVDALEQLVAENAFKVVRPLSPDECYAEIVSGNVAMAITWPSSHPIIDGAQEPLPIAVASLPGAHRGYDYREQRWKPLRPDDIRAAVLVPITGRMASLSRSTRRLRSAQRFEAWLMSAEANREFSSQFSDLLLTQSSQLTDPYHWVTDQLPPEAAQEMAEVLRQYHDHDLYMPNIRIPGRDDYISVLANAVQAALRGDATPQDALDKAAAEWDELTAKMGLDQQREFFQGSVRLEK